MKAEGRRLILVHLLLLVLLYEIMFVPNQRTTVRDYDALLVGIAVIEALFLFALWYCKRRGTLSTGPFDIILVVWLLMIVWELTTSVLNVAHPVLVPCPENVFDTFRKQWSLLLLNVGYSMELLLLGFALGLTAAVLLGLVAGWVPRIRAFAYPIANVMAPIPAIVISPYLVALMPTFRSASLVVIILGIFWPTFLTTVNRVQNMEVQILDSARTLQPSTMTMLTRILLPYILPGVISGLRVSMTTSLLMLNFAELMGATHGMGYYVQNSITYANYTHAVAGIFVIGIVVTILNFLVGKLQKWAIRWH
ncbi:MAG: ABC transporter permease subunit [Oscillospiraceae bacterium]|jgi:nitrate/sulfonate/bicarbonate ABC transporter, permease protein